MKRALATLALALAAAPVTRAAADDSTAQKSSDSVVYPLPKTVASISPSASPPAPAAGTAVVGPPAAAAPGAPATAAPGNWTETEDSPALRVSRAWVKLGQAADVERSEPTHRLYATWRSEVAQNGPHARSTQAAHAQFLAAYKIDLEAARKIYEGVLREVDAMDSEEGSSSSVKGDQQGVSLSQEAEEALKSADRDDRLSNAACFLAPDNCVTSDPADKSLQDEISGLLKDTLEAGGPDGSLSLYSLRRKASLLSLRARVMSAITQRAAARLATEVATAQDGQGNARALPSPVAPVASAQRRAPQHFSDPYR